jgi:hypothetical protein
VNFSESLLFLLVTHFLLQVEDTLFKVPRYLFEESSEIFRDMFLLPTPEGTPYDGSSDEQPLFLEGVRKMDFRRLLWAMDFTLQFESRVSKDFEDMEEYGECEDEPILCDDWASALELSCMWQMARVRDLAVKKILQLQCRVNTDDQVYLLRLSTKLGITKIRDGSIQYLSNTLQPVKQIQLGIELQVHSWVLAGYTQLVQARGGLSMEHVEQLGRKTTLKLPRIRDEYLWKTKHNHKKNVYHSDCVTDKIKEVFAEELKEAVWAGT